VRWHLRSSILGLLFTVFYFPSNAEGQMTCGSYTCDYVSAEQMYLMEDALMNYACTEYFHRAMAALWGNSWGRHYTSTTVVDGFHHTNFDSSVGDFHYSIRNEYPFFDTVEWGLERSFIQLAGLQVHEIIHHELEGESEGEVDYLTTQCVPGYDDNY
jgi:hypothetical protein